MQIPYLLEFFDTYWYSVQDCTFELYAVSGATFVEILYHAQLQPFNLVALDTDFQKHLDDRVNWISAKTDQITKLTDSCKQWITFAEISKPLPHSMLLLNDRHQVHLDFVTSVDFLGKIYRVYEDLIRADPANQLGHMTNCDIILGKVRKGLKRLEMLLFQTDISDQFQIFPYTISRKST